MLYSKNQRHNLAAMALPAAPMQSSVANSMSTQSRVSSLKTKVNRLFSDFTEHSTIHGVTYVGESQRSWFERIFWVIGFCLSIFCCATLIIDAWNINPIIISFAEKPTPIWQTPFPAVTICPTIMAQTRLINISDIGARIYIEGLPFDDLPENEKKKVRALFRFCSTIPIDSEDKNDTCNGCLETLREIRIQPEDMFVECKFQNRLINCTTVFAETVQDIGICYTFNGLQNQRTGNENHDEWSTQNWNVDDGYRPTAPMDTYPRRALGANKQFGLSILLRLNEHDIDYACNDELGFYVEFQMPSQTPRLRSNYYSLRMGDSATFVVKPKIMTTSNDLRKYPIAERKCVFRDERPLKFFKEYTQSNCELDCMNEFILQKCGCLQFELSKYRRGHDICGNPHFNCLLLYRDTLSENDYLQCNCLPACSEISFDTDITVSKFDMSTYSADRQKGYHYNKLILYFKETQFMTSRRSELYGMTDFVANCGGILGLCLGVSIISILEIFYFCTIRWFCYLRRNEGTMGQTSAELVKVSQTLLNKRRRVVKTLKNLIADYSNRTSIQGINYMADSGLSVMERFWWTTFVVISSICCGSLISDIFNRYDQTPMITTYENEKTRISEIPFPAVTVCPQIVSKDIIDKYDYFKLHNRSLYNLAQDEINAMAALAQVCDPELFGDIDPKNQTNCDHCSGQLKAMMGDYKSIFSECKQLFTDRCENVFTKVVTEGGVCYTFNGLDIYREHNKEIEAKVDNWTLDHGYTRAFDSFSDIYPRTGTRTFFGLRLTSLNDMIDGLCKGPVKGFNVYLHLPNEAPQISKQYYLLPFNQAVEMLISPRMIKTAVESRDIPVYKRQCYFIDERYLRFFRYYTQNNCEVECVANLTITRCGCQRFYLPKPPGVKYCGISDMKCYLSVMQENVEQNINQDTSSTCRCLPTCTTISFDAEINQFTVDRTELIKADNEIDDSYKHKSYTKMYIIFKESYFISLKRSELYGQTELLANCGGLLGLFLGFSLMSILEIFYYCVIRMFCDIKNQLYSN